MTTFQRIIDALHAFEGVLNVELIENDVPMFTVRLVIELDPFRDTPEFRSNVLEAAYEHVAAGVAIDVEWKVFKIGIDWSDPVDQELRERIRAKVLDQWPAGETS